MLRMRWLGGVDAPPADVLVDIWREAVVLFEDFGHVHELARSQAVARRHPARHRRPGRRPRARRRGPGGRPPLGAQPLLDELRALGSAPARSDGTSDSLTPRERRSWRWSPRAARTARSASSCSSAPRPSPSTSPTSSASSAPPVAPRPPRSPGAAGCSTDAVPHAGLFRPGVRIAPGLDGPLVRRHRHRKTGIDAAPHQGGPHDSPKSPSTTTT